MINVKEALSSNLINDWDSDDEDLEENAPQSICV